MAEPRRNPLPWESPARPRPAPARRWWPATRDRTPRPTSSRCSRAGSTAGCSSGSTWRTSTRPTRDTVVEAIRRVVHELLSVEKVPLNFDEREGLVGQILDEIFGLGPIEPLMKDPEVSDILVNTWRQVIIERHGKLERTEIQFQDDRHLLQVIDRIVSAVGRRIDDSSPMVDARLPDGSRVNAIIKPLAIDGPHLSIRKFKRDALSGEDLLRLESLNEPMLELLRGDRAGAAQRADFGRHRLRQDDAAQHSLELHSAR